MQSSHMTHKYNYYIYYVLEKKRKEKKRKEKKRKEKKRKEKKRKEKKRKEKKRKEARLSCYLKKKKKIYVQTISPF